METTIYESAADTAKKVRLALKTAFPGAKFSVRADTYAGGSTVRVSWTDGPTDREVWAVAGQFESAAYDPVDDLKSYPGYEWHGRRYLGAHWVSTSRHLSDEYQATVNAKAFELFGERRDYPGYYPQHQFEEAELALRAQLAASEGSV